MHSLLNITEVLSALAEEHLISADKVMETLRWLNDHQTSISQTLQQEYRQLAGKSELPEPLDEAGPSPKQVEPAGPVAPVQPTLQQRIDAAAHPIKKRLLQLVARKRSNLCVSLDETSAARVLQLVDELSEHVVLFKLHCDIIDDFDGEFIEKLRALAAARDCLLFEDRKFADIGNTVRLQFSQGSHRISSWAHLVNCHAITGAGVLDGLRKVRPSCLTTFRTRIDRNACTRRITV